MMELEVSRPVPKPRQSLTREENNIHVTYHPEVLDKPPLPPARRTSSNVRLPLPQSIATDFENEAVNELRDLKQPINFSDEILRKVEAQVERDENPPLDPHCDWTNHVPWNGEITTNPDPICNSFQNSCISAADGESVSFSDEVEVHLSKTIKKKKCCSLIRNNQLYFTEIDEAEHWMESALEFYDLSLCVYMAKISTGNHPNNSSAINLIFRDPSTKNNKNIDNESITTVNFKPDADADVWISLLAKCSCPRIEVLQKCIDSHIDAGANLWIKRGINGVWTQGWAHVFNRTLYYSFQGIDKGIIDNLDMRKVILIKQRDIPPSNWCNFIEHSAVGPVLIASEGSSLYMQSSLDRCTILWREFLESELLKDRTTLEQQRLTSEDVPVIVDKCIKLVSAYGLKQPGIYRKSGSEKVKQSYYRALLEDPYSVHLTSTTDEHINAIAGALREFLRSLSAPLIPRIMHDKLIEISGCECVEDKIGKYRLAVLSLPRIHYQTLKKLLDHLDELSRHSDKNMATVENVCMIFGPTIFSVKETNEELTYTRTALYVQVTRDLLVNFYRIFAISHEELVAKSKLDFIQETREQRPKAIAKGFLIPIHLFERDNKCFNIQAEWTAGQVVAFKLDKLPSISPYEKYSVFEVIKNGQLERRLGDEEALTPIVLGRWLEWSDQTNTDFFLLLKKDQFPFNPQDARPFADDVKIAEYGSHSFKIAHLKIESGTKVAHFSKTMKRKSEWIIDEMIWFVGAESGRKPPHPYSLTFFLTNSSHKNKLKTKFPGYCVTFKDEVQRNQWLNSIVLCKQEFLPVPLIQI